MASATGIRGFIYVPLSDQAICGAAIGTIVRNAVRAPPYIAVAHQIASLIVTRWPGRLLAVEVIDPVTPTELPVDAQWPTAYTRAVGVRLLEELAVSELFGPSGAQVIELIEAAHRLSLEDALALGVLGSRDAPQAYAAAWRAWLAAPNRSGSPIHQGFSVLSSEVRERALVLSGALAMTIDEDGEVLLAAPWNQAGNALAHAAMALGAPDFVAESDRASLLQAWLAFRAR